MYTFDCHPPKHLHDIVQSYSVGSNGNPTSHQRSATLLQVDPQFNPLGRFPRPLAPCTPTQPLPPVMIMYDKCKELVFPMLVSNAGERGACLAGANHQKPAAQTAGGYTGNERRARLCLDPRPGLPGQACQAATKSKEAECQRRAPVLQVCLVHSFVLVFSSGKINKSFIQ